MQTFQGVAWVVFFSMSVFFGQTWCVNIDVLQWCPCCWSKKHTVNADWLRHRCFHMLSFNSFYSYLAMGVPEKNGTYKTTSAVPIPNFRLLTPHGLYWCCGCMVVCNAEPMLFMWVGFFSMPVFFDRAWSVNTIVRQWCPCCLCKKTQ